MDYMQVGKIVSTHGIKGEVKTIPLTDDIKRFDCLEKVYIGENKVKVEIENVRYKDNTVILKFKDYDDINLVLKYKNEYIYIDIEDKIELGKDQYFIFEIMGCKIVDTLGCEIGTIVDILEAGSNDVYVVKDENKEKEYFIPAVKQFIKTVDVEKKLIEIDPIEGMIE